MLKALNKLINHAQCYSIKNSEISLYFILWIGSVCYSIYSLAISANDFFLSQNFEDTYNDFTNGWSILSRLKDVSDSEWKYDKIILIDLIPWFFIHIIVAEFLRNINKQFLNYWYSAISLLYLFVTFDLKALVYFLFQPVLGYLSLQFKSKTIVWFYYITSLIIISIIKWLNYQIFSSSNYTEYMITSGIFWINLRSLNYFLEAVNDEKSRKISFKNILTSIAYCLYLPLLFSGPVILFTDFKTVFLKSEIKNISQRIKDLIKNLLRFIFWALFIEFSLHFIYINALAFQPQIMNNLNSWALYGGGYCMGQFFQLKYVVFYGLSTTLANFEGIPVPTLPKCIGRIHLYSDMWKYFDRGLYIFLVRYIYIPLYSDRKSMIRKLFSTLVCFIFVYVWHGIQTFIAIWSFLNFVGVTLETIAYELSQTDFAKKITKNMSEEMYRRLKCVLATPLFVMSSISNFYFFAGKQIGDIYVHKFLTGSPFVTMNILIILYCGCQVSTEIKIWESRNIKKMS